MFVYYFILDESSFGRACDVHSFNTQLFGCFVAMASQLVDSIEFICKTIRKYCKLDMQKLTVNNELEGKKDALHLREESISL